ncbi:MAG: hypothetical protein M1814_004857 [Vezdaea aestivalis]|nr:MAG: hypothetical protein M1814_004857 [Vezdaea aestivalis]
MTTANDIPPQLSTDVDIIAPPRQVNITVLLSGEGTNLQALLDSLPSHTPEAKEPGLEKVSVTHVVSSKPSANGLNRASKFSIPISTHTLVAYKPPGSARAPPEARTLFDTDLAKLILHPPSSPAPDLVLCLGYMLILTPAFLDCLRDADVPVFNLHPALPGAFDGVNAIQRAWEAGRKDEVKVAGVMLHEVVEEVDRGKPVLIKEVEIKKEEALEDFEQRMHKAEWEVVVRGTEIQVSRLRGNE